MNWNWRKNTTALMMLFILIVVNACNFPGVEQLFADPQIKYIDITEVSVTPESGSGDFTLTFSYMRKRTGSVSISCNYVAPDGNTYGILAVEDSDETIFAGTTKTQNFSVVKTGDAATEGLYTATCQDEYGLSKRSDFFTVGDDSSGDVAILDVKVMEGAKYHYALEMTYMIRISEDVSFTCNYVAPGGGTFPIGNYTDDKLMTEPLSTSMFFSIEPREGQVEPGIYVATCQDDELRSKKSTNFVVVSEPTPTATITPEPQPLAGQIIFDYGHMVSGSGTDYGNIDILQKACVPGVTVSTNGEIDGTCAYTGTVMGLLSEMTVTASVTGTSVQGGTMNCVYTVIGEGSNGWDLKPGQTAADTEVWNNIAVWQATFTATGAYSTTTTATGTANINFSCDSGAGNLYWCSSKTKSNFTGTVPWTFTVTP